MPIDLTQRLIDKTVREVAADRKRRELQDSRAPGLFLRVQPRGSRWGWRAEVASKTVRLDLGPLEEWVIGDARLIAMAATTLLRSKLGIPDDAWLHEQRVAMGRVPAALLEVATTATEFEQWSFNEARTAYLGEVRRTLSPATHADYKQVLSHALLKPLTKRKVSKIGRADLAEIVAAIHRGGTERHAEHLASVLRPMWKWLADDAQAARSGVVDGVMTRLAAPARTRATVEDYEIAGGYVPPMIEVGRIVAIARSGALDPVISTAIELLVLTVQRRRPIVSARGVQFRPILKGDRGLWSMPPSHRKTAARRGDRSSHVLPLVPRAWALVSEQLYRAGDKPWLFPGFRPKRAGAPVSHMNVSVLTHNLLWMPGVNASPHDIRRAFATHGENHLGWSLADIKTILDHNEGVASGDVTRESYALGDGTHMKWPIMLRWADLVEASVQQAIAADPRLLDRDWIKREIDKARYERGEEQAQVA